MTVAAARSTVTLTDDGNANVTIASVAPVGAGFSTNGLSAGTALTPNQSATLNIVFAPTGTGSVSGSVRITSNATNSPASISLSGAGVRSTSHSVDLSWTASASPGSWATMCTGEFRLVRTRGSRR